MSLRLKYSKLFKERKMKFRLFAFKCSLHKKCMCSEFLWSVFFRIWNEYGEIRKTIFFHLFIHFFINVNFYTKNNFGEILRK